ncbi:MAG: SMP-30/gluconolactonase/LRE family protein [Phycisphaerae bacterium]|nr:SMP-30/gluconolactonase/LRE family protein [Phycisphaerae bacterium]MDW8262517.1 SMP-30/gluconolactonase/LRE family protein [Phycisphaerales bacterium]
MPIPISRASIFADGLDHSECLAAHPDGTWFAGGEAGQIYHISADGKKVEEIGNTGGFVLGIALSPDRKWLACCDLRHKCVFRFEIAGRTLSEFARGTRDEPFSIPNHLCFTPEGDLFVTDSGAFRKVSGRIYRFRSSGEGSIWHRGPFNFTNGIALGPDGKAVFVCCTWLPGVEKIEIRPDGSAGKRSVYARIPKALPDGLAFDARGNLYVSCYTPARIYRIGRDRKVSVLIDDWEAHILSNPTNIAFGGKNFDELYAANLGRWHLTRIALKTRGLPLASHLARPIGSTGVYP